MAVIKNKGILKCLLMIVVSLFLILNFSIGVSASTNYDRQEADACITIIQKLSVKGGSKTILPGEGDIGIYKDLIKAGKRGDNITPHHMPSAEYMSKKFEWFIMIDCKVIQSVMLNMNLRPSFLYLQP